MKGKRRSGGAVPCEGDLTPRSAVLGLGLLLFLATPAQLQQLRIESGSVLTPCRETRGQLPGGALSYDYTKALLARLEACALFNRRFMAENLPLELSALTVTPRIEVPSSNELKRLTEEQAFLRIYQLLVVYSSFAQHTANTSLAPGCGRPSKRTGAALLGAAQRNADQLQELRCDVRLSSGAHGSKAQFEAADASAQGLLLDTYADCSKRLLEDYRVALGIQKLLHSVRGYLVHLVRLKSPFQGAEVAELSSAVEALEPAAY